jgi:catechol 2,3-dioxygenase-like lactoylglutathione lyase family enzyme
VDTVTGIPGSRSHIVMLPPPEGGTGLELSSFVWPDHEPGSPTAMANELGLRNVAFEVDELQATVDRLAADGYGLVGGIGQYENIWRMAYVRGPEGIIVSLAERIGWPPASQPVGHAGGPRLDGVPGSRPGGAEDGCQADLRVR